MTELILIEPQRDFPKSDVIPGNAAVLELLLKDPRIQTEAHNTMERTSPMLRMAHRVLSSIGMLSSFNSESAQWFSSGIARYEATSGLIRHSGSQHPGYLDSPVPAQHMAALLRNDDCDDYFTDAYLDFCRNQPRLEQMFTAITEETISTNRSVVEMVIFGAAVQRRLELEAMEITTDTILDGLEFDLPDDLIL